MPAKTELNQYSLGVWFLNRYLNIQMSRKHTIFTPIKGPKASFVNELYAPYYSNVMENHFHELDSFQALLGNPTIKRLYDLTIENLQCQAYTDAVFFADKLLTLSDGDRGVVFLTGQCYFHNGDYKKVHSLFSKHKVLNTNIHFQILAAKATLLNKQYDLCVTILDMTPENTFYSKKLESCKYLLRAQCCEAAENKVAAVHHYSECLKKDPTSVEAFSKLMDCFLLTSEQKEKLISDLDFTAEDQWLQSFYLSRVKDIRDKEPREQKGTNMEVEVDVNDGNLYETLVSKENIDMLCIEAKNAFSKYDIIKCYDICQKAIKEDPLYFDILPFYCACLLDLGYVGEIYYVSHNLVESYPNHALSWFAIGTYYFLTKKYETARKFFQKALLFDRNYIYAWVGLAHSFAIQDESDQAMSIYRSIARLFPGCHASNLYMGMEYLRLNNKTALLALQTAKQINPLDPLVFNEIGAQYYKTKDYTEAKYHYMRALELAGEAVGWIVEIILCNLSHCLRKLKDYKGAIKLL